MTPEELSQIALLLEPVLFNHSHRQHLMATLPPYRQLYGAWLRNLSDQELVEFLRQVSKLAPCSPTPISAN